MNIEMIKTSLIIALRTRWRTLLLLTAIIITATVALVVLKAPTYQASWVLLLPGTERSSTVNLDNIGEARTTTSNAYGNVSLSPKHTYREIALSPTVLNLAAVEFGIDKGAFTKPNIKMIQQTPAIRFTLKGANAERLELRSKVFHDVFLRVLDDLRANELDRQDEGVRQQLTAAKSRLKKAQARIVKFKSKGSVMTEAQLDIRTINFESLRSQVVSVEQSLVKAQSSRNKLSELLGVTEVQAAEITKMSSHPQLVALLPALHKTGAELNELKAIAGEAYPLRRAAQAKFNQHLSALKEIVDSVPSLSTLKLMAVAELLTPQHSPFLARLIEESLTVESHQAEMAMLKEHVTKADKAMRTDSAEIASLDELQRDYQIAEAIFSSGLTRLDSSKFDVYATYPLVQLLTLPGGQIVRDHLGSKLILVAGILLSILVCVMLVLFDIRRQLLEAHLKQKAKNV
jgi:uncharacterized protein involved in exopolysaccharide biosynthesis